jgi:hypothetical protein
MFSKTSRPKKGKNVERKVRSRKFVLIFEVTEKNKQKSF